LPPHRQTDGRGGRAILFRIDIVQNQEPVPCLIHLKDTAIQVILPGTPLKILAAYLSPSRPLIGADLTHCFGGGLPGLMARDLNAKHVD